MPFVFNLKFFILSKRDTGLGLKNLGLAFSCVSSLILVPLRQPSSLSKTVEYLCSNFLKRRDWVNNIDILRVELQGHSEVVSATSK